MNQTAGSPAVPRRLASLDAYRGAVMLLMMGEVLEFCRVAEARPSSRFWQALCWHQSHVQWVGCSLHDLIQPSFSFLVGVALPFSLAARAARGQSPTGMNAHAFARALILILLGIFLRSVDAPRTNFTFEDTLTQIGLGYGFLFVLARWSARVQWIALATILVGYWLAFALWPLPLEAGASAARSGVSGNWGHHLQGFARHWDKNTNLAWAFDRWFLNLFPRTTRFAFNSGGYTTLSAIPTLATMILGLRAGDLLLRGDRSSWRKVGWLVGSGLVGLGLGYGLGFLGICPVVKRIWTPSWVLFSGGWCALILAMAYAGLDLLGIRWPFYPLLVVGRNSIAAYVLSHLLDEFLRSSLATHFGRDAFLVAGPDFQPLLLGGAVLLLLWLILFWMDRRKLYLRV